MYAMRSLELSEVAGREFLIRRQSNPPKVVVEDETKVPGVYFVSEVKTSLDKKKLSEDLKSGQTVAGARLERGERLAMKVASSTKIGKGEK
jgi:hypothetical protein